MTTQSASLPTAWTQDELDRIGNAEELEITSVRRDGTPRKPVTIWVICHGDHPYIRSGYGRTAAWFRGVQARREGHITAGGIDKDILVADADAALNDQIDATYRAKYHRHGAQYVDMMVSPEARATTLRLVPRVAGV